MKLGKSRQEPKQPKEIILDVDTAESYRFSYSLSYEEAYSAFSALAFKRSRRFQLAAGIVLTAAAVLMLVLFALDPRKVMDLFLAIVAILLLFYLIYFPVLKAKRGARSVARTGGTYRVEITDMGTISIPHQKPIDLDGDKDARAIETPFLFIIRPDTAHTFCIPKRVMKDHEVNGVRDILSSYMRYENENKA